MLQSLMLILELRTACELANGLGKRLFLLITIDDKTTGSYGLSYLCFLLASARTQPQSYVGSTLRSWVAWASLIRSMEHDSDLYPAPSVK
jgi:hypothetical protein